MESKKQLKKQVHKKREQSKGKKYDPALRQESSTKPEEEADSDNQARPNNPFV